MVKTEGPESTVKTSLKKLLAIKPHGSAVSLSLRIVVPSSAVLPDKPDIKILPISKLVTTELQEVLTTELEGFSPASCSILLDFR